MHIVVRQDIKIKLTEYEGSVKSQMIVSFLVSHQFNLNRVFYIKFFQLMQTTTTTEGDDGGLAIVRIKPIGGSGKAGISVYDVGAYKCRTCCYKFV